MRNVLLILIGLESLVLLGAIALLIANGIRSDLAGQGMGQAVAIAATVAAVLLLLAALLLAWHGRALWLALILSLIAAICVVAVLVA